MSETKSHDFTRTGWGHAIESPSPYRFITWSTPRVQPGDTVTYVTQDFRKVTYRALREGYTASPDVLDMATFTGEKVENTDE